MKISSISFIVSAILLIYVGSFFYPKWQQQHNEAQISWDAGGYYWYLPSTFIYQDLKKQDFKDSIIEKYKPIPPNDFQYGYVHSSGNYVIRYTMGTAILELPFFLIAHAVAEPLGYPADGFSKPYQVLIYLGGLAFALLGLWYFRKLMLLYYSDLVVGIVLLILVFGTNYLNYCGIDVGITHCWLFTLYVFIILNTHYYYASFKRKYALRLGILVGITALVRPPEIISVVIPLLWGIENISFNAIKDRLLLFKKQLSNLLTAAAISASILSLQFIYWKYATGHWFVYTYQNQGFSWLRPHLKQYALNYQTGWLLYTPMMILSLVGILLFLKKGKNKLAILSMIAINYYIVAAWNGWEYGGRAMIQNYVVLMFPLASLIQYLLERKLRFYLLLPILLIFTYFNLWWTWQAHMGQLVNSVPATSNYYWSTIFRYNLPIEIQKLRDNPDMFIAEIENSVLLYENDFNTETDNGSITIIGEVGRSFSINRPKQDFKWIRASADIHVDQKEWDIWHMTQFIIILKKGGKVVQQSSLRLQRFLNDNDTKNIYLDLRCRKQDFDRIEISFRNENKGLLPCTIDNLKLIGFND